MAFIEIGFNTKRPLILGRGGFGTQLNDWLMDEGWGSADFLDDNAPDAVGGLRDYVDPAILKRGRPAFVALGDNKLRVELLQKLAAAGYSTPVFISDAASVSPSAVLEPGCIILPQAYVGADAHLGVGCIVNAGAIVDHNAHLVLNREESTICQCCIVAGSRMSFTKHEAVTVCFVRIFRVNIQFFKEKISKNVCC